VILLENPNNDQEDDNKPSKDKKRTISNDKPISKLEKGKKADSKNSSEEELDLEIPKIPEPPKNKNKLTIASPGLSTKILEDVKKFDNKITKVVLVNCERCKDVIFVPIPRAFIIKSKIPVVPVSFVHKNPDEKDLHCITLYLDKDFDIRRQRLSDVVISEKI
jgi:hypothetical protein